MTTLHELGNAVHARRSEMGLTQARVARLSGLTRQTVNQVENGTVVDLSLNRASRLAEVLGLSLAVRDPRIHAADKPGARSTALARAARTASVSYRQAMAPAQYETLRAKFSAYGYDPAKIQRVPQFAEQVGQPGFQ